MYVRNLQPKFLDEFIRSPDYWKNYKGNKKNRPPQFTNRTKLPFEDTVFGFRRSEKCFWCKILAEQTEEKKGIKFKKKKTRVATLRI